MNIFKHTVYIHVLHFASIHTDILHLQFQKVISCQFEKLWLGSYISKFLTNNSVATDAALNQVKKSFLPPHPSIPTDSKWVRRSRRWFVSTPPSFSIYVWLVSLQSRIISCQAAFRRIFHEKQPQKPSTAIIENGQSRLGGANDLDHDDFVSLDVQR